MFFTYPEERKLPSEPWTLAQSDQQRHKRPDPAALSRLAKRRFIRSKSYQAKVVSNKQGRARSARADQRIFMRVFSRRLQLTIVIPAKFELVYQAGILTLFRLPHYAGILAMSTLSETESKPAKRKRSTSTSKKTSASGTSRTRRPSTAKSAPKAKAAPVDVGHEAIAERAWSIWQEQGCPAGRELEHWLQAEEELRTAQ